MEHTMDEQMRAMVEDGTLSEGAYKALLETLGEALKDSATSVISNDDDVSGVHLFEDHFIRTTIVTTKDYNRTECGDVLLLQNTIISVKPYRKRAREE